MKIIVLWWENYWFITRSMTYVIQMVKSSFNTILENKRPLKLSLKGFWKLIEGRWAIHSIKWIYFYIMILSIMVWFGPLHKPWSDTTTFMNRSYFSLFFHSSLSLSLSLSLIFCISFVRLTKIIVRFPFPFSYRWLRS